MLGFVMPNISDESGGSVPASIAKAYTDMENAIASWNPRGLDSSAADSMYAIPTAPSQAQIQQQKDNQIKYGSQPFVTDMQTGVTTPLPRITPVTNMVNPLQNTRSSNNGVLTSPIGTDVSVAGGLPNWVYWAGGIALILVILKG